MIEMSPDLDPGSWDHSESDRYGLGTERDVSLFYKLFLIERAARKATPICPFVVSGTMHRDFQPYLRADGNGIDYSYLQDYDTRSVLAATGGRRPSPDKPYWVREIEKGISNGNRGAVLKAVGIAKKIGVFDSKPAVKVAAEKFLQK
jgi:hypothetical protein